MSPLPKKDGVASRTKFVARWNSLVCSPPPQSPSDSEVSSESESACTTDSHAESTTDSTDDSGFDGVAECKKTSCIGLSGVHDKIMKDHFIGKIDVHVKNLIPPHPSRAVSVINHDHVSFLTDSFVSNPIGQIVTLVRMVGPEDDNSHLDREGGSKVEVLGGNHTREALLTLHARGTLDRETVQVNLYRELPQTTALSIGFQHNAVLQEGRKQLTFLDKVRLMRHCRPSDHMTKRQINEWKDGLVVVFRSKRGKTSAEDRRRLSAGYQQHLNLAQLPEDVWSMFVQASDKNENLSEKFFRPLMRINSMELIRKCLTTLLHTGQKEFRKHVKSYIDEGYVKSNKNVVSEDLQVLVEVDNNTKEVSSEDEIAQSDDNEQYKEKYFTLKEDHEKILLEHAQLLTKYQQVQKQLDEIKAGKEENRGLKRPNDSNCDISKGDDVQAKWVDEDGNETWLSATVTKVLKHDVQVQFHCDQTFCRVPRDCIK
ncbi:uncharacterized protein LOC127882458 [Dreissena polymorpha]|nr:uncharacterized protein LOC127882458 [Dreissena polymorpha]